MTVAGTRARIDLSGRWQLAFDPTGEGIDHGWIAGRWPEARSDWVEVPTIWNVTHPDAAGPGFYRRLVHIPSGWEGRVIRLAVGGASYRLDAWLNHRYLGGHEGAYTPFALDLTAAARPGAENELVLKVTALAKDHPVDGLVLAESPAAKQAWYYTYGGLWGDVALEALPPLSVGTVGVEPDLRRQAARVEVALANAGWRPRSVALRLTVTGADGRFGADWEGPVVVPPGGARFSASLAFAHPRPWSVDDPFLYRLRAAVIEDTAEVDAVETMFGMRDFTVRDGRFFLNDEPIFLRVALLQPNYPVTLVAPPEPELMRREIALVKEAGFNMIRAHLRPAPPGYLDLTDRLGLLVYAESSLAWIRDSPRLLDHGRRELAALIERDRNHPSVAIWGILNENRAVAARTADDFIRHVRALDPTRVVIDNSGGSMAIDQDFGWIDRATVVPDRETERRPFHDLHVYFGAPTPRAALTWLRTLGGAAAAVDVAALGYGSPALVAEWQRNLRDYDGQIFVSEIGCGGMADLDATVAGFGGRGDLLDARELRAFRDSLREGFAARRLERVFPSVAALARAAQELQVLGDRRQIEALMLNPRVAGYGLTQVNDVAWEFHAGFLDLWRRPKPVYAELARLNRPRCLIVQATAAVAVCGGEVELTLAVVDRVPARGGEVVEVTVREPGGRESVVAVRDVPADVDIKDLGPVTIRLGAGAGAYRVTARLVDADQPAPTSETIHAVTPVDWVDLPAGIGWVGPPPNSIGANGVLRTIDLGADAADVAPLPVLVVPAPGMLTAPEWESLLAAVAAGGTAVLGPLRPGDDLARRVLARQGLVVETHPGFGNWMGCYHWQLPSALFEGVPGDGLAGEPSAEVVPQYVLSELGGEVLAGSFRNTETRKEAPRMLWSSDVEVVPVGAGRLVFCQYRVFGHAAGDPLADRLLLNLLRYAAGDRT